jgi:hypothetical protein
MILNNLHIIKISYCFLCGKNCGKDAHPHFREEGPCKDQLFTERTKPQGVTELAEVKD